MNREVFKGPTRRQIVALMSWKLAAGLVGCSRATPSALTDDLQNMADQQDLAILSLVELSGRTITGAPAGTVVLRDRPYSIAVSPDGNWTAWDNWSARPKPEGVGAAFRVMLATPSRSTGPLAFDSWFGGPLAVSSKAEHVALVRGVVRREPSYSLVVADGTTGLIEHDVTSLITMFPLSQAIRLTISGSGDRLVIGSSEWFTVIDLTSRELVVYEAPGRYASLSPDGQFLAFVDEKREVPLLDLSTRTQRVMLGRSQHVSGIGAWSPNGQYLLAGFAGLVSKKLVAVKVKTGQVIDMMPLGDLAGDGCVWIKKGFLSANSPLA